MEKRIFIRCEDHDIPAVIRYPEDGQDRYPAVPVRKNWLPMVLPA